MPIVSSWTVIAGSAWPTPGHACSGCLGQPAPRTPRPRTRCTSHGLAAPFTINTMPDSTLEEYFEHGDAGDPMPADGGERLGAPGSVHRGGRRHGRPGGKAAVRRGQVVRRCLGGDLLKRIESQTAAALSGPEERP